MPSVSGEGNFPVDWYILASRGMSKSISVVGCKFCSGNLPSTGGQPGPASQANRPQGSDQDSQRSEEETLQGIYSLQDLLYKAYKFPYWMLEEIRKSWLFFREIKTAQGTLIFDDVNMHLYGI
jgi:hypothetical protein